MGIAEPLDERRDSAGSLPRRFPLVWLLSLLVLVPLQDTLPNRAQIAFDHALTSYHHGQLARSQQEAEWGYQEFRNSEPGWAARFKRLEAEVMLWRGLDGDALRTLAAFPADAEDLEAGVAVRALEANAYMHRRLLAEADQRLTRAERICQSRDLPSCGEVLKARGSLKRVQGDFSGAFREYKKAYAVALAHQNLNLQTTSSLNTGLTASDLGFFDEAQYWLHICYRDAVALGDEDLSQLASDGLGWAYFQFGDAEESRRLFQEAMQTAARLGNLRGQLYGLSSIGEMDAYALRYPSAIESYQLALKLARQIDDKTETLKALGYLADVLTKTGKLDESEKLLDEAADQLKKQGSKQDTWLTVLQGDLAVARHEDAKAEELYRNAEANPRGVTAINSVAIKSRAESGLAEILARHGQTRDAEAVYKTAMAEFELARAHAVGLTAQLSLLTVGMPLHAGYIKFLVQQGRIEEALTIANQSRAQTLEGKMNAAIQKGAHTAIAIDPRRIAAKSNATLLFYWLAERESYLWVVTPQKVRLFTLPPQKEIEDHVVNYRKALLEMQDPIASNNPDGRALYTDLLAPAASLIPHNSPVVLLDDGILSKLNFETLPVPGSSSAQASASGSHYWIEDATVRTAPSLTMLALSKSAVAKSGGKSGASLLLMGNADSASPDYPQLPMAPLEMKLIQKHFAAPNQMVFAKAQATPAAYLNSVPARYSYIHFVTHGVASSTDPLDSSIILSPSTKGDGSFKLYARDILQRPIDARLVTISACYGSGSRAFSGEGLVGLSWAFLGAGARNVIGALWEVSDESTPHLMDNLYQGIQQGLEPSIALRQAKLNLLHGSGNFRAPFFWAPFQVYTVH